jgi:hypothetical protein
MANREWRMVEDGERRVASDERKETANGEWRMVNGGWRMVANPEGRGIVGRSPGWAEVGGANAAFAFSTV